MVLLAMVVVVLAVVVVMLVVVTLSFLHSVYVVAHDHMLVARWLRFAAF